MQNNKEIRDCSIGIRLTPSIKRILLEDGLPISKLVEAGIVHFLKLSIEDKISFLANNIFKETDLKTLPRLDKNFESYLNAYLDENGLVSLYKLNLDEKIKIITYDCPHAQKEDDQ
jgi:uncharacterized protein YozE (UPF0346 family)